MFSFATYTSASIKVRGLKPRCSVRRCRCGSVEGASDEAAAAGRLLEAAEEEGCAPPLPLPLLLPLATGTPRVDLREVMLCAPRRFVCGRRGDGGGGTAPPCVSRTSTRRRESVTRARAWQRRRT